MAVVDRIEKIKSKFARKAIKEIATQISEMPDEIEPKETEADVMDKDKDDKFISKRDLCMFLGGVFAGYLLFHNTMRISSRSIRETGGFQ